MRKLEGDAEGLVLAEPRPAVCATVLSDGRCTRRRYGSISMATRSFTTWHEGVKARADARTPPVALRPGRPAAVAFVSIQGVADATMTWRPLVGRRGSAAGTWAPTAPRSTAANGVPGELLVRVRPTKVVGYVEMAARPRADHAGIAEPR
jgi:hypothetical protein